MVTIMVLVGGSMTLGLAFACAFCRVAAQADVDRDAAFARSVHEEELEHLHCQGLDDAAAGQAAAPVLDPEPRALAPVLSGIGQASFRALHRAESIEAPPPPPAGQVAAQLSLLYIEPNSIEALPRGCGR
jgi:hypothetical protein